MMIMQSPFAFAVLKGKDMVVSMANDSIRQICNKGNKIEGKLLIEILPELKNQEFPVLLHKLISKGFTNFITTDGQYRLRDERSAKT